MTRLTCKFVFYDKVIWKNLFIKDVARRLVLYDITFFIGQPKCFRRYPSRFYYLICDRIRELFSFL